MNGGISQLHFGDPNLQAVCGVFRTRPNMERASEKTHTRRGRCRPVLTGSSFLTLIKSLASPYSQSALSLVRAGEKGTLVLRLRTSPSLPHFNRAVMYVPFVIGKFRTWYDVTGYG
ncbi:hypothetical protein PGTUg99_035924 [Puccinia graminis f. sp. tritici]|uniref:Uncharacterized protein n=1 Tax=Puccinia graminis f. sp. tritici TaxID=56615 RepID=A0A5B0SMK5_PUCGR|nr:hypothetical protein PGTUg99_035924 [Puccinia graminis f. sp. tritici]